MMTDLKSWWQDHQIGHQHLRLVTNTFRLHHRWNRIDIILYKLYIILSQSRVTSKQIPWLACFPCKSTGSCWIFNLKTGRFQNFHILHMSWAKSHNAVNCDFGKVLLETWIIAVTPCFHNFIFIGCTHVGWNKEPRVIVESNFWKHQRSPWCSVKRHFTKTHVWGPWPFQAWFDQLVQGPFEI